MATATRAKLKATAVAGLVTLVAAAGLLAGSGTPASADVTAVAGFGFGAQVTGLLSLGPVPVVSGGPAIGFPAQTDSVVGVAIPSAAECPNVPLLNLLQVCAVDVGTVGVTNPNPHLNGVGTSSELARVDLGSIPVLNGSALNLVGLRSSCFANGDGASGDTQLVSSSIGLSGSIAKNTSLVINGILEVHLNEQIFPVGTGTPGVNQIKVNAARIKVLGTTLEVTLGHVECTATGPDVNNLPPSTTAPPTTSGPTTSGPTTSGPSTTTPNGASTTTPNGASTTTPSGGVVTTTPGGTSQSSVTTVAPTGVVAVLGTVLARTGAMIKNGFVWAALVLFLGALALLSSRGELQTWPPKRRPKRTHGPKRTSSTWPKRRH